MRIWLKWMAEFVICWVRGKRDVAWENVALRQ